MKRLAPVALWLGVLMLALTAAGKMASPTLKTTSYFSLQRAWDAHWPLEPGKRLPLFLSRWFQPFTPVWVQVEPHITMLLDPTDYVSSVILATGSWENTTWQAIQHRLEPGATFVDIGAHIGYYSLKGAVAVGPQGHVISVEPNPDTVRKLRDNIRASGAGVVAVQPVACTDAETTLDLFVAPAANTGETSLSRANASQAGPSVTTYRVRARPLDDIVRESGVSRVDAVKIDVEGAELLVLQGARETLARYHPLVLVEVIDRQLQAMGASAAELTAFMRSQGYVSRTAYEDNFEFTFDTALAAESSR